MAKILIMHMNRAVYGVQYPGIASLAAFVRKAGHQFRLFDIACYQPVVSAPDDQSSYRSLLAFQHKPINAGLLPKKRRLERAPSDLLAMVSEFKPDLVGVSCFSYDWPLALYFIRLLKSKHPMTKILVGGVHATIATRQVLAHPEVFAACIGEGEKALVELLDSLDRGAVERNIANLWFRTEEGQVLENPLRPALSLDRDLPFADFSDLDDLHFAFPFEGEIYRRGSVYLSRGCPYACRYCVNNYYHSSLGIEGYRHRYKDMDKAIEELAHLKRKYQLEFLRFWDECFLALPKREIELFARRYKSEINLPFTIEAAPQFIRHRTVKLLSEMGCKSISLGVETSNEALRKLILGKPVSNQVMARAFNALRSAGMRSVANFMFFLPHQSLGDMVEDIIFCRQHGVDSPSPRIFYPFRGTALREDAEAEDLLDSDLLARCEDENRVRSLDGLEPPNDGMSWTTLRVDRDFLRKGLRLLKSFVILQRSHDYDHADILKLLELDDKVYDNEITRLAGQLQRAQA